MGLWATDETWTTRDGVLRRDLDARSLKALLQECLNVQPEDAAEQEEQQGRQVVDPVTTL